MQTGETVEAVLTRITKVFKEVFDDDTLELTRQTTALNIDGWDSMMQVNLVIAVEQEFGVRFSGKEMSSFQSVGDLEDLVRARLNEA